MVMTSSISYQTTVIINSRKQDSGKCRYKFSNLFSSKFIILGKKAPKYDKGVKVKMKKKRNRSVPSYSNIYR